jgi:hypothetical protein
MKRSFVAVVFLLTAGWAGMSPSQGGDQGNCPWWRPCGPGNSFWGNRLIGQGFGRANFRPACASHDACLAAGIPRHQCDGQFLANMNSACNQSQHPVLCRLKAFKFYAGSRVFGGLYH